MTLGVLLSVLVFGWVLLCARTGWVIGQPKGRQDFGMWMGILFGPLGWIAVGVMEPTAEVATRRMLDQASYNANAVMRVLVASRDFLLTEASLRETGQGSLVDERTEPTEPERP